MNHIDRVAKAIAHHFSAADRAYGEPFECARAAIEALAEPTGDMIGVGAHEIGVGAHEITGSVAANCCHRTGGHGGWLADPTGCECREAADRVWRAMHAKLLEP